MATLAGPATAAGAIVGTLHYMSPEQIEARDADVRSDIFAFGLVLYELIAGKRPFDGKSSGSIIASILKDQPQPIAELCPGTPRGIDRIVRTCLEKDPDSDGSRPGTSSTRSTGRWLTPPRRATGRSVCALVRDGLVCGGGRRSRRCSL